MPTKSVTIRAAWITGACLIVAAIVTGLFSFFSDGSKNIVNQGTEQKIETAHGSKMEGNFFNNVITGNITIINNVQQPPPAGIKNLKVEINNGNLALGKPVFYLKFPLIDESIYYERYSVNLGYYASNLTDGNHSTMAYPASRAFQYIVDFEEVETIKRINLVWGSFGISNENLYVTNWELYNQKTFDKNNADKNSKWELVKFGGIPGKEISEIVFDQPLETRRLKIVAISFAKEKQVFINWIGIFELEAYSN